jgi:hypothetical protein
MGRGIFFSPYVGTIPQNSGWVKVTKQQIEELFFRVNDLVLDDCSFSADTTFGTGKDKATSSVSLSASGSNTTQRRSCDGFVYQERPYSYQLTSLESVADARKKMGVSPDASPYSLSMGIDDYQTVREPNADYINLEYLTNQYIDAGAERCVFNDWDYPVEYLSYSQKSLKFNIDVIKTNMDGSVPTPSFRTLAGSTTGTIYGNTTTRNTVAKLRLKIPTEVVKISGTENDIFSGDLYIKPQHWGFASNNITLHSFTAYIYPVRTVGKVRIKLKSGDIVFPLFFNRSSTITLDADSNQEIIYKPTYWEYANASGSPVWGKDTGELLEPESF